MAVLFLTLFFLGSAFAQNGLPDIVATLNSSSYLTKLVGLIDQAGLTSTLASGGPFTIFAPENLAFSRLDPDLLKSVTSDNNALADLLKYHVVQGNYSSADLSVNEMMLTSLAGPKIRVNDYLVKRRITLEGSYVTYPNKIASNGIVHRIHNVMLPPKGSILDIAAADANLTTLVAAVNAAGIGSVLNDGPYTLLAPTNDAFAALGNDTVAKLIANPALLADILKYHVIPGTLYSSGMHSGSLHNLEIEDQERVYASFLGYTVSIDNGRLTTKDISATNGVIHKINHVLVPYHKRDAVKMLSN